MSESEYTSIIKSLNEGLSEKNREKIIQASKKLLLNKEKASEEIKKHYNEFVYDTNMGVQGVPKYLQESLIREIIQNIIDCDYDDEKIIIFIEFNDNEKLITFKYNENGFKISNLISFFSLDHTSKDSNNTGAFGIGAKGAISAAKKLVVKSVYNVDTDLSLKSKFEICTLIKSNKKTLEISELKLQECSREEKCGTSIQLFLEKDVYKEIKHNFYDLIGEDKGKGKYLTPIDLVFASLKKIGIPIKITIDKDVKEYDVCCNKKDVESTFSFSLKDKRAEVTFKVFINKENGFSYLIPYSRKGIDDMPAFIKEHKYNIFSTYELTGALESDSYLSNFCINIPTIDKKFEKNEDIKYFITNDRKGIQDNKKNRVDECLLEDFKTMIGLFKTDFILSFRQSGESFIKYWRYILVYFYQFIEYKIRTSNIIEWTKIKLELLKYIYIQEIEQIRNGDKLETKIKSCNKLDDIKKYKFNEEQFEKAKKIEGINFLFCKEFIDIRRIKFDFKIIFYFIIKGKVKKIHHDFNRNDNYILDGVYDKRTLQNSSSYNQVTSPFDCILSSVSYQDSNEIDLLSAANDESFTDKTLLNLLKAICNNSKITCEFDNDTEFKKLIVGEKDYEFNNNFIIEELEILFYAYEIGNRDRIKNAQMFFDFIRKIFLNNLFSKDKEQIAVIERIKKYQSKQFYFEYNSKNNNLLNVYYKYQYKYIPIETDIDVSNIEYNKLTSITRLSNYKLFKGKSFNEFIIGENVIDIYGFDSDKINSFISNLQDIQNDENERISSTLNKTVMCCCDFNLGDEDIVAFVRDNKIEEIVLIKNVSSNYDPVNYDYIAVIPHKNKSGKHATVRIHHISQMLDSLLKTNGAIRNLYKPTNTPIRVMIDQYSARLKPIMSINKNEFATLTRYLNRINSEDKMYFAKDLNNKLYGYSTCCSICNYDTNILNAFQIKSNMKYRMNNKSYKISLYLCANDYFASEGWIISDIKFRDLNRKYTITFSKWLENIRETQCISSNLLKCEITIIQKTTYNTFSFDNEDMNQNSAVQRYKIVLTPLMAAKWYKDNE